MEKALHMNNITSFEELQIAFSNEYPFLKLDLLKSAVDINTFLMTSCSKTIDFPYHMTVTQLIKEVQDSLGATVCVQRKTGNVWIPIILTTEWTLEHQNREGKFLSQ